MDFVNGTDETIEIEPGEAISVFKVTTYTFEGSTYRVVLDQGVEKKARDELYDPVKEDKEKEF